LASYRRLPAAIGTALLPVEGSFPAATTAKIYIWNIKYVSGVWKVGMQLHARINAATFTALALVLLDITSAVAGSTVLSLRTAELTLCVGRPLALLVGSGNSRLKRLVTSPVY